MYSLRIGSWKELETKHIRERIRLCTPATSVDGTIFWFGYWLCFGQLVAFDIATEVFTLTTIDTENGECQPSLYMLGNKLAMCEMPFFAEELSKLHCFCISVIEECAGESGKSYNCTEKHRIGLNSEFLEPLCIWSFGGMK